MKKTVIATLAGAFTLALGMHSAIAADMKMNADSKIDQKPMHQSGTTGTPTPGWEKLSKNKNWKPAASGAGQPHASPVKADSNVVPEHQGTSGMHTSHASKSKPTAAAPKHKTSMAVKSDQGHSGHMKSGAAKPAGQGGAMPMQHGTSGMKSDSNVVPVEHGQAHKPAM
ncbi:hypothetical protein [Advenella mimigardefordensis]|uniref:hypothetical protein n=1 Tax=Advenella mimigardefordensis TaxID=302406 RepID=UPI00046D394E|nr:hypothetical protein [Advenella mimigardefordensis]